MTNRFVSTISQLRLGIKRAMTHKAVGHVLLALAALTLASSSLMAADSETASLITAAAMPDTTNLYTIYSNLGPPKDRYYDQNGELIGGPDSGQYYWWAMPFTPKANAKVTEIETALLFYSGTTNGVVLSLYNDSNGLPGKAIHTWNLKNLPLFSGGCCRLDVSKDSKGLTVKKGTQYWVVASTNSNENDTQDVWCFNYNEMVGNMAQNYDQGGWRLIQNNPVGAFGVFGEKVK